MCEFISWIETERDGKTVNLYLTDKDVFSPFGREKLANTKDNDVLGHGAIRAFYGLGDREGTEREVRNFWETDRLPEELREKLKDIPSFNLNWGEIFSRGHFTNDDLRYIIIYAPEEWKVKACKQLLVQNPTNYDLRYIIYHAPEEWKAKAAEHLLVQNPTNYDLRDIIIYAPEEWKVKAWDQLVAQNPTNDDLCLIIIYAPEEWKVKAQAILDKR